MGKKMRVFLIVLAIVQLITVIGIIFYFSGYKRYGTPSEFKQKHLEFIQARLDSIEALERDKLLPENVADSTLFGVGRHTEVFEELVDSETRLKMILSSLDSLKRERKALEEKEKVIDMKLEMLESKSNIAEQGNYKSLANIYNNMKAPQAIPLFITMNDTVAVSVLSLMNQRNASRLLGALAEADLIKAARLNKMLAEMGK